MPYSVNGSTPKWVEEWLTVFRDSGNVRLACDAVNIDRSVPYKLRDVNPEFAAAWKSAEEDAIDSLEAEATKRAKASSDTLLIFLLKSLRPEKYQDVQRLEMMFGRMSDEQLDAYIARRLAAATADEEAGPGPPALPAGDDESER